MTGGIISSSFALSHVIYCQFFTVQLLVGEQSRLLCLEMEFWHWHVQMQLDLSHLFHQKVFACDTFSWAISLPSSPCSLTTCTIKSFFLSACDRVKIQARKLRKKINHKQPRRKDKINPPTEEESSELIYFNFQLTLRFSNLLTMKSTSNLG